ncbi:hypothetical protein C8F04DRAFT_1174774 [Mycena alexandri]|uniref:Uncharacterized protein n=1 Tax=Mycena alexandri TaxID=1745969 RepID=A0AAD6TDA0_9AGAR|nr:hypothetical protein C8F04DRAFT_1174774 [Mycena alexandri]
MPEMPDNLMVIEGMQLHRGISTRLLVQLRCTAYTSGAGSPGQIAGSHGSVFPRLCVADLSLLFVVECSVSVLLLRLPCTKTGKSDAAAHDWLTTSFLWGLLTYNGSFPLSRIAERSESRPRSHDKNGIYQLSSKKLSSRKKCDQIEYPRFGQDQFRSTVVHVASIVSTNQGKRWGLTRSFGEPNYLKFRDDGFTSTPKDIVSEGRKVHQFELRWLELLTRPESNTLNSPTSPIGFGSPGTFASRICKTAHSQIRDCVRARPVQKEAENPHHALRYQSRVGSKYMTSGYTHQVKVHASGQRAPMGSQDMTTVKAENEEVRDNQRHNLLAQKTPEEVWGK